jgi:hypothetical protein
MNCFSCLPKQAKKNPGLETGTFVAGGALLSQKFVRGMFFGFVSGHDFAVTATPADSFSLAVSASVVP